MKNDGRIDDRRRIGSYNDFIRIMHHRRKSRCRNVAVDGAEGKGAERRDMIHIKNVKPGDILTTKKPGDQREKELHFYDTKWKIEKVYEHIVLARSMKCPAIRRSFSVGDLVQMGLEHNEIYVPDEVPQ